MHKGIRPKKWSGVYGTSMEQNDSLRGCGIFHTQASEKELIRVTEWPYGG